MKILHEADPKNAAFADDGMSIADPVGGWWDLPETVFIGIAIGLVDYYTYTHITLKQDTDRDFIKNGLRLIMRHPLPPSRPDIVMRKELPL